MHVVRSSDDHILIDEIDLVRPPLCNAPETLMSSVTEHQESMFRAQLLHHHIR